MKLQKEDTLNIIVNIGNDTDFEKKIKINTDEDGFAVKPCMNQDAEKRYPENPESSPNTPSYDIQPLQPMPTTDIPEESRIIDDNDNVVYTVLEMCKQYGAKAVIESLKKLYYEENTKRKVKRKIENILKVITKSKERV